MNDPKIFAAHLETTFLARLEGEAVPIKLIEVSDERAGRGMRQFSLFFHGSPDRVLPQGLYEFEHAVLGSLTIFIVPIVGSNTERILYQACFSHPVPEPGTP
jgi:hypothetical protein